MDSTALREQRQTPHPEVHAEVGHQEAPANRDVVFETRDLSVFYGEFRAVRDVSLTIYRNHITALIGPSGCGKTTFIRCLNLSLIHISEPTRLRRISYAVFCLKKKNKQNKKK